MTIVGVAGSFNLLHEGHKAMLAEAFQIASNEEDCVYIALTDGEMFYTPKRIRAGVPLNSLYDRTEAVRSWIKQNYPDTRYDIYTLKNPYLEVVLACTVDVLVCSEESRERAEKLVEGAEPSVRIVAVPMVKDSEGRRVSSTYKMKERRRK